MPPSQALPATPAPPPIGALDGSRDGETAKLASSPAVTLGLDPRVHDESAKWLEFKIIKIEYLHSRLMDTRVKPEYDDRRNIER